MKRSTLPTPVLLCLILLLIPSAPRSLEARDRVSSTGSGAIFAASAADGGRLLITRSPTLGRNVTITLTIDGKPAGLLSSGRIYDRYITPGRHLLSASASWTGTPWHGTLDVRPGQTYPYSASYNVNQPELTPRSR